VKIKKEFFMTVEEYLDRADMYCNKRKYDKAIDDYTKAIELEPDNPFCHSLRGMAYANKKEYDFAIADFSEAIRLEPDEGSFYYKRALIYVFQENKNLVIKDFEKFLELSPDDEDAEETRDILDELKNGKIVFYKGRIVDIDEELNKRSILIIILNFIPIIPFLGSFVKIWNGFGEDPVGLKDDFKYIKDSDTYTLGDGIPILGFILAIPKVLADMPNEGIFRGFLRFFYVLLRFAYFWGIILAALLIASPFVGIVQGIMFLVQRKILKKLSIQPS
jgi:tetratricopeptide (TPR) repeat protein